MQFNEMRFARLHTWDFNDRDLVIETPAGYRFTAKGLTRYWMAVDNAVQFWMKSQDKTKTVVQQKKFYKKRPQSWLRA